MKAYIHIKEKWIPIYRGKLVIILSNSTQKVKKLIPELLGSSVYAHTINQNWHGVDGYIIVLNFDNQARHIFPGTITHEAIHCAHFLARGRDIIADFENDEPIAYLVEWITDEVYKFVYKKGFNITKP